MKPVLPEKNTTKLPKRYWFTLIFMLFITILSGIYVYSLFNYRNFLHELFHSNFNIYHL